MITAFGDPVQDVRETAVEAVGTFGPEAVPALIGVVEQKSSPQSPEAARALAVLGPKAKDAVAALVPLLSGHGALSFEVRRALAEIGEASIPALLAATRDERIGVRVGAVDVLAEIGEEAVPALLEALRSKHLDVRRAAAAHLANLYCQDSRVALAFAEALKDDDERVRDASASGLSYCPALPELAILRLREALTDTNVHVRSYALSALEAVRENPRHLLRLRLKDAQVAVRIRAAAALLRHGDDSGIAVLNVGLNEQNLDLRVEAGLALAEKEKEVQGAVALFTAGLASKIPSLRERCARRLLLRAGQAESAMPALLQLGTCGPDAGVREAALRAYVWITFDTAKTLPVLAKMLQDSDPEMRRTALRLLIDHDGGGLRLLANHFEDEDATARYIAVHSLPHFRYGLKEALPKIRELLKHADPQVRRGAATLAFAVGHDAAEDLLPLLGDRDVDMRQRVLIGLLGLNRCLVGRGGPGRPAQENAKKCQGGAQWREAGHDRPSTDPHWQCPF